MEERNKYLEADGLLSETETHEWFMDKTSTDYARNENLNGISLPDVICCVIRNKETGEYDRLILEDNKPIYDSKSLESIGIQIDKMKIIKDFD